MTGKASLKVDTGDPTLPALAEPNSHTNGGVTPALHALPGHPPWHVVATSASGIFCHFLLHGAGEVTRSWLGPRPTGSAPDLTFQLPLSWRLCCAQAWPWWPTRRERRSGNPFFPAVRPVLMFFDSD